VPAGSRGSRPPPPAGAAAAFRVLPSAILRLPRSVARSFFVHPARPASFDMARGEVRIAVTLACEECKRRNYQTSKNRRNDPDRIEMRKFCRWCGHHTPHKETR